MISIIFLLRFAQVNCQTFQIKNQKKTIIKKKINQ
ncbi:unnamed protein product [Paramecium octaurelia]|uniref:Uncharacterized protein n=1 Tax=Paramecium octaurelia TaxID=43137 RepID=A0A8S1XPU9_PAROT|nr:unnamed protein product [Paramecium octaurelia]